MVKRYSLYSTRLTDEDGDCNSVSVLMTPEVEGEFVRYEDYHDLNTKYTLLYHNYQTLGLELNMLNKEQP